MIVPLLISFLLSAAQAPAADDAQPPVAPAQEQTEPAAPAEPETEAATADAAAPAAAQTAAPAVEPQAPVETAAAEEEEEEPKLCRRKTVQDNFGRTKSIKVCRGGSR